MSMLSAQCDELRAMAESVGLAMPQAATLMMEAAGTIWELRNRCSSLVDERERMFRANVEKNCDLMRLMDENTKLRKLVDGWAFCSNTRRPSFDECVGCPLFVQTPHSYRCARNECMRELGVDE